MQNIWYLPDFFLLWSDRPYALLVLARDKPLVRKRAHPMSKFSQKLFCRADATFFLRQDLC
jgi:hypothetical protein